ncbi:MAG: uroporphyrinogen-III synthase [Hyphomicrobiales bacterium]
MKLIVTRPEEDAGPLLAKLAALGHQAIALPLLKIVPRPGIAIPGRDYQAICVTSANAIRALGKAARLAAVPVLTVGPQSLHAARQAGFTECEAHGGDVRGLADFIVRKLDPALGPLLYLSGAETSGDLEGRLGKAGFDVTRLVLYDAVAIAHAALPSLRDHDGVLLYSPRSARLWAALVRQAGHQEAALSLAHYCLSANVAAALPPSWPTSVAESPRETAMLALLDPGLRTR